MTGAMSHTERLLPGPLGWTAVLGFAAVMGAAVYPAAPTAAVVVAVVTLVVGVGAVWVVSPRVTVADGELRAGRARIPLTLLGEPEVLDREQVHAAMGPGSDARVFALLRAWLPGAVLVPVEDPADPTPAWLISSRRAPRLAAALRAGQDPQAAHSEQIG